MGGADIDAALRWPATNRQMNGLAFAIVKLIYNRDAGTTSLSPITFKCSHYLNGAGVAKPGDVLYDYLTNTVYALDATTIDLCLSLFPWARFRRTKGAVKMHTLLDLRGNIPTLLYTSDGKLHDVNVLDLLLPEPGAF